MSVPEKKLKAPPRIGLIFGSVAVVMLAGAGAVRAQTTGDVAAPETLVKAAQAEGEIMLYSSADTHQSQMLLDAFQKKYGIKGSFLRFPTAALMQRFSTEYDNKAVRADVLSVSTPIPYEEHKDWFEPISAAIVPNLAKWPAKWIKSTHMTWTADTISLAYNTDEVSKADVPKTWAETADPKWKGRILLTDPQVADNYLGWLDAVERANGMDFLRKLATQNYTVTQSGASGAQLIAAGAQAFNMPTVPDFSAELIAKHAPIALQYMSGPLVVSPRDVGLVAAAPHPNAAKLYLNWLLSDEAIKLTCGAGTTSVVADPDGKLGCVGVHDAEPLRFDISKERAREMAVALGVAH